jgi:hypothetical protein
MGQGDVPISRGGPFRRRREKRQLEQLAAASELGVTPRTASAHVRVIEDQTDVGRDQDLENPEPETPIDDSPQRRTGGFHVRAVPIDQPVGEQQGRGLGEGAPYAEHEASSPESE